MTFPLHSHLNDSFQLIDIISNYYLLVGAEPDEPEETLDSDPPPDEEDEPE